MSLTPPGSPRDSMNLDPSFSPFPADSMDLDDYDLPPPPVGYPQAPQAPTSQPPLTPTDAKNMGIAGAHPSLAPLPKGNAIPDDEEPIGHILNKVRAYTGDLEIKVSFQSVDTSDKLKAMAFRNPPTDLKAPSCFYYECIYEISGTDKDGNNLPSMTLRKNIYTNFAIPTNNDATLYKQQQIRAGTAASVFATVVRDSVLIKTGRPPKTHNLTNDQVTKVQRDNFIMMGLYSGKNKIGANQMVSGDSRKITHINLMFRAGKKEAKDEEARDSSMLFTLDKVHTASKRSFIEEATESKYELVTDEHSLPEIKALARLQRFRSVEEKLDKGNDPEEVIEKLGKAGIDEDIIVEHWRSERSTERTRFEDRWNLFDNSARVDVVSKEYGRGVTGVSQELKSLLPEANEKVKITGPITVMRRLAQAGKKTEPLIEYGVLRKLVEADIDQDPLREEADRLIGAFRGVYNELVKLDKSMTKKENYIATVASDSEEIEIMEEEREKRTEVLKEIEQFLGMAKVSSTSTATSSSSTTPSGLSSQSDSEEEEGEPLKIKSKKRAISTSDSNVGSSQPSKKEKRSDTTVQAAEPTKKGNRKKSKRGKRKKSSESAVGSSNPTEKGNKKAKGKSISHKEKPTGKTKRSKPTLEKAEIFEP